MFQLVYRKTISVNALATTEGALSVSRSSHWKRVRLFRRYDAHSMWRFPCWSQHGNIQCFLMLNVAVNVRLVQVSAGVVVMILVRRQVQRIIFRCVQVDYL